MPHNNTNHLTGYDLIMANFWLAGLKFLAVFPTQPLQVIMRWQQAVLQSEQSRTLSIFRAAAEIRSGQSFRAFFKGVAPASGKEGLKNLTYKGILIKGAPTLAETLLPDALVSMTSPTQYHLTRSLTAGIIAGFADSIFGGALETVATYQAASHGKYAQASFYQELKQQKSVLSFVSRLYRGFVPATVKGTIAFSTFFVASPTIQQETRRLYHIEKYQPLPWYGVLTTALATGLAVAATSAPFDIVKTQAQMPGARGGNMWQIMANNYRSHGINGITAGIPAKMMMITMGWGINYIAITDSKRPKLESSEVATESPKMK